MKLKQLLKMVISVTFSMLRATQPTPKCGNNTSPLSRKFETLVEL